ncbi:MAG: hypothetical protein HC851_18625 [Acaryochloris sp. RU_4_1]|nr:hypothetical protein [Acaryochloris sp. RU_4_1]NJR56601.1 hypothetical protein [Acaryochloris sp. CRU_2_0]
MKNELNLSNRRIKRLTAACFYMSVVSALTILLNIDKDNLPWIAIKSVLVLATVYLVYLRKSAIRAKRADP